MCVFALRPLFLQQKDTLSLLLDYIQILKKRALYTKGLQQLVVRAFPQFFSYRHTTQNVCLVSSLIDILVEEWICGVVRQFSVLAAPRVFDRCSLTKTDASPYGTETVPTVHQTASYSLHKHACISL